MQENLHTYIHDSRYQIVSMMRLQEGPARRGWNTLRLHYVCMQVHTYLSR